MNKNLTNLNEKYLQLKKLMNKYKLSNKLKSEINEYLIPREKNLTKLTKSTVINEITLKFTEFIKKIEDELKVTSDSGELTIEYLKESTKDLSKALDLLSKHNLNINSLVDTERSKIDREINDILHYIEFNKTPKKGRGATLIYAELHSLSQKRRALKNYQEAVMKVNNILKPGVKINKVIEDKQYTIKERNDILSK